MIAMALSSRGTDGAINIRTRQKPSGSLKRTGSGRSRVARIAPSLHPRVRIGKRGVKSHRRRIGRDLRPPPRQKGIGNNIVFMSVSFPFS